jgi:serine/threonine-protein kinase
VAVGGGARSLASETNLLRQSRLRAGALFLMACAAVLVVWSLLADNDLWPLHTVMGICLGVGCAILSRRQPVGPFPLRALEFTIFGLTVAGLAVTQYHQMLHAAVREDARALVAEGKNALIASLLLMFVYTMLIPNSWRAAAAVVLVIAVAPVVTEAILLHRHPEVSRFASAQGVLLLMDGTNPLLALMGAGLGIYGVHVLNTLRREVFEARRLNQYHLGERLGTGGMGDVYLAEHRLLKRRCALKLIRPESAGDPRALARFEREVRAAARLSHPNIVEIYDYGLTQDGTFYYVMEYLRGLSFADLVVRHGPVPAGRVIYLLRQASAGLAEAHAAGLIHRDLKPANIFAAHVGTRYDVTKLLDFGLVKEVAHGSVDLSGPGVVLGTPLYAAPEQAMGRATLDHRADLYALGAVAYYLLTGRAPFEGDNVLDVLMAHARDPVVPPSRHRPEIPGDLEQVVLRSLAKDPTDRYPNAEALGQALADCAAANAWDSARAATWWQEAGHEGNADQSAPSSP